MFTTGPVTGEQSGLIDATATDTAQAAQTPGQTREHTREHAAGQTRGRRRDQLRDQAADAAAGGPAGFRPDIEGLRAVAILLVVVYHCGIKTFGGGYTGVDVFFVISGFLITSHLVGEVSENGRLRIGRFYGRRILRLLPAATLVISSTLVAAWYWLPVTRLHDLTRDALAANGYFLNYRLANQGNDYRSSGAAPSPLQHFWSLGVEEQFYLVIPLVLVLTLVLMRRRWVFTVALGLITAGSLWWSVLDTGRSPVLAYFGAPTRAWELGAGALLAMAGPLLRSVPKPPAVALRWLGLAAILLSAVVYDDATSFPGYHALLPVGGAVAVIAAGCTDPGRLLTKQTIRSIGTRSYSWYLWHWPVLLIGPYALAKTFSTTDKLIAVAVAYGLAVLTYAVLERPIRESPRLRDHPLRAGALGITLTAAAVAVALILPTLPPRTVQGVGKAQSVQLSGPPSAREKVLARKLTAATQVQSLPRNLTPSLKYAAYDEPSIARDGCLVPLTGSSTPKRCESLGDPYSHKVVVLLGDSHAAQWYPAMSTIARQQHWRLAVFVRVLCPAAAVQITLDPVRGTYDQCTSWRTAALARIGALHPAMVVTSSIADHGDLAGVPASDVESTWSRGWTVTTRILVATGAKVVYLDDTPTAKEDVPGCLSTHPRSIQQCTQTPALATGSKRRGRMAQAAAGAGARVIDPTRWFCARTSCPVVLGNILIYRDSNHISTPYIRLITPLLAERLKPPAKKAVRRRN